MKGKRAMFVLEVLADPSLNGTRAAIRAGYARSSASETAYKLLRDPDIKAAIDAAMAERAERVKITQDSVILRLVDIADKHWETSPASAVRAAELLGKHVGMFREKVDHTIGLRLSHEEALAELDD